jgi:putative colanic acid biosynthesis UDP-glucose lipid carrier transferase
MGLLRQHSALLIRLGSLFDALGILVTFLVVLSYTRGDWVAEHFSIGLVAALIFEVIATVFSLYRSWRVIRFRYEIIIIFFAWSVSMILLIFGLFFFNSKELVSETEVIIWFLSAFILICIVHYIGRLITRIIRSLGHDVRRVAFIGANEIALKMKNIYRDHPWMGMKTIGIFDDRHGGVDGRVVAEKVELVGNVNDLIALANESEVDIVYVCLPLAAEIRIKYLIDMFSDTTVSIYYCPNFINFDLMHSNWDEVYGQPVISIIESPFVGHHGFLKRAEDLFLVLLFLPALIPLFMFIAVLIKATSKGPVFFKQDRYGQNGRSFKMWKFRTMDIQSSQAGYSQATRNDPRVTRVGAFLRKTSLDEIPQFINVLFGDMSVVGPRPHPDIVNEDLRKRIYRYMLRHKIKPGITGLAQVNGFRGETETIDKMKQRIQYDLQYIRHWSIILDLKIILKTILIMKGSNVY